MHIELVDTLRCPYPHDDTWLVASVSRFEGRDIVEGSLGCPSCRRQFAVRDGEVDFTERASDGGEGVPAGANDPASGRLTGAATIGTSDGRAHAATGDSDAGEGNDDALLRARALLALGEPGGIVLLGGEHARHAEALEGAAQVRTLQFNAAARARRAGHYPSALRAIAGIPVASGSLRAAWLDHTTATPAMLSAAARALRRGGRLVAPAGASLPDGVRELARDAREWVAEGEGGMSPPVALRRR